MPQPNARRAGARRALPARLLGVAAAIALLAAACSATADDADPEPTGPARELRLGYFANVTHAPALVGVATGAFEEALGETELTTQVFNAGPAAIEALNAGAVDAAFLGPSPAINGFVQSEGESLRIVAGAAAGGAQLVVRPGVDEPADLESGIVASPQLGGTQDVALRTWLTANGLENTLSGRGDVTVTPTENAQTLQLFRDGDIDGAWVPEPWASRLVLEAGGEVLVDERDLWPDGEFLTTHLVVATSFLERHPETVAALIAGELEALDWVAEHPEEAKALVNDEIEAATTRRLADDVLDRAFTNVTFTADPLAGTLEQLLADGVAAGTTRPASLEGIYDLRLLNAALAERERPPVSAAGLGPGDAGRGPSPDGSTPVD